MPKITLDDVLEPLEVEIAGDTYRLVGLTKHTAGKLAKLAKRTAKLEDLGDRQVGERELEEIASSVLEGLDLIAQPVDGAPKLGEKLRAMWDAGDIDLPTLLAVFGRLQALLLERANPPSPGTSAG